MEALCSFGETVYDGAYGGRGEEPDYPELSAESRQTWRDVSGPSFIRFQVSHGERIRGPTRIRNPSFQPQIWMSATCGALSSTDELQLSKCLNPDDPGTI